MDFHLLCSMTKLKHSREICYTSAPPPQRHLVQDDGRHTHHQGGVHLEVALLTTLPRWLKGRVVPWLRDAFLLGRRLRVPQGVPGQGQWRGDQVVRWVADSKTTSATNLIRLTFKVFVFETTLCFAVRLTRPIVVPELERFPKDAVRQR